MMHDLPLGEKASLSCDHFTTDDKRTQLVLTIGIRGVLVYVQDIGIIYPVDEK